MTNKLLFIVGVSSSGKSTDGELIVKKVPNFYHYDIDKEFSKKKKLGDIKEEGIELKHYSEIFSRDINKLLETMNVVVSGTFPKRVHYENIKKLITTNPKEIIILKKVDDKIREIINEKKENPEPLGPNVLPNWTNPDLTVDTVFGDKEYSANRIIQKFKLI